MRNSEGHDVLVEPACFVGVNYELVGISRTCANARDARYLGAANYEACGTPDRLKPSLDGGAFVQSESCHLVTQAGGHRHASDVVAWFLRQSFF